MRRGPTPCGVRSPDGSGSRNGRAPGTAASVPGQASPPSPSPPTAYVMRGTTMKPHAVPLDAHRSRSGRRETPVTDLVLRRRAVYQRCQDIAIPSVPGPSSSSAWPWDVTGHSGRRRTCGALGVPSTSDGPGRAVGASVGALRGPDGVPLCGLWGVQVQGQVQSDLATLGRAYSQTSPPRRHTA